MTQPGTPHLDALTGLRGIAAWFIVAYHFRLALAPFVPASVLAVAAQGTLAVDLFFVMSGFIIALNYRKEFRAEGMHAYGRFLLLRLARIYPLHLFMLGMFVLYAGATSLAHGQDEFHDKDYLVESVFLVQAWLPWSKLAWNIPAWSISTEMFAYLVFPAMAWAAERTRGRAAAAALLGAGLLVLALGARQFGGLAENISRFGLERCVLEFFAGVMVQRLWELGRRTPWSGGAALALGAVLIACFAAGAPDWLVIPGAFCCLVYGFAIPGTAPAQLLAGRLPVLLGTLSYATYLSHYLVVYWVKFVLERPGVPAWVLFPAYIAIVLLVSWPLYELVEVPGRRALRRVASRVTSAPRLPASRG
jgi:peptidoglycan/LPS O-acetylase OafA/YrhL